MKSPRWSVLAAALACVAATWLSADLRAQDAAAKPAQESAKPTKFWIGHNAEIEQYIKTAKVVREEDLSVGVTHPKRLYFAPGGPVGSVAWNNLDLQFPTWDSYKADIAAYELDKLLQLNLVPPIVERDYKGQTGRASTWIENMKMYNMKAPPPIPPEKQTAWSTQIVDMKMFDNLIGNVDRNQGNMLYDSDYTLVLIDHTRAFASGNKLPPLPFEHVDKPLWDRMQALTEPQLKSTLEKWLPRGMWKDILKRRALMEADIKKLIAKNGEANVWIQ
jgi:hypothetical protein